MSTRIAVTGAGGYLGRHVVTSLLERGVGVIAAGLVEPDVDDRAQKIELDVLADSPTVYQDLGSHDVVIHLAWRNGFLHNDRSHIDDLPDHYRFLERLVDQGLKHLVVMGTMHEVGYYEGAIREDTPTNPGSLYGISKNALRQSATLLTSRNDVVFQWIRAYYIVGDDKHSSSIFAKLLEAAEEGRTTFPFTSGKNKYDFISIEELADQIAAISLQDEFTGVINACTGEPMSLADRVEAYIEENDLGLRLEYGAFPDRPYDSPGVWGDASDIRLIMQENQSTDVEE